jgi:hypothetical protein
MTSHHTARFANAFFKAILRRRFSVPIEMNGYLFADIGLNQSDIIALHISR